MTKQEILDLITNNIASNSNILAVELRQVLVSLLDSTYLPYETRELDCPQQFIDDNFNEDGLGINLMVGWEIIDKDGRFVFSYGDGFSDIAYTGGSRDAVVVSHNHVTAVTTPFGTGAGGYDGGGNDIGSVDYTSNTVGESGIHKNMPPYVVRLRIKRTS